MATTYRGLRILIDGVEASKKHAHVPFQISVPNFCHGFKQPFRARIILMFHFRGDDSTSSIDAHSQKKIFCGVSPASGRRRIRMLEMGELDSAGVVPWDWCALSARRLDNASRCSQHSGKLTVASLPCDQKAPEILVHDASNKVYGCTKGKTDSFSSESQKREGNSLWGAW